LTRKTKEKKVIKELQEHIPKYDTKIEDIQVQKRINFETLTAGTLEKLFYFMNIAEGDNPTKVNQKIHQSRIELTGQKPTKVKMEDANKFK